MAKHSTPYISQYSPQTERYFKSTLLNTPDGIDLTPVRNKESFVSSLLDIPNSCLSTDIESIISTSEVNIWFDFTSLARFTDSREQDSNPKINRMITKMILTVILLVSSWVKPIDKIVICLRNGN
ncbi:MAG: hypothetical protein ACJAWV_003283 [Flammeovirgaceae bacterium]|jgi:hypothetical protein